MDNVLRQESSDEDSWNSSLKLLDYGFFFLRFLLNSRVVINHFPSYQLLHIPYGIFNKFHKGIGQWKALESAAPKEGEKHVFWRTLEGYNSSYRPRHGVKLAPTSSLKLHLNVSWFNFPIRGKTLVVVRNPFMRKNEFELQKVSTQTPLSFNTYEHASYLL